MQPKLLAPLEATGLTVGPQARDDSLQDPPSGSADKKRRLPRIVVGIIVAVSSLPFVLSLFGVDFASASTALDLSRAPGFSKPELVDALHESLSGGFAHTILEWSAVCVALFTAVLAVLCFWIRRSDAATPIIGVALLCAGCMDAFHTLSATRLIEAAADNTDLIPFTWALCRLFNVLIVIVGVAVVLSRKSRNQVISAKFVAGSAAAFALLAYSTIAVCASSRNLPQTMFPDSLITRPYDVAPMILFLVGIFVIRRLHRKEPSYFSHSLLIAVIPNVATQLHMSLGSVALFDHHFNIAHGLKIVAYLVPLTGLCLHFLSTQRERASMQAELARAHKLESVGQLAAGIAHEINTPTQYVGDNTRFLQASFAQLGPLLEKADELAEAVRSGKASTELADELNAIIEKADVEYLVEEIPRSIGQSLEGIARVGKIVQAMKEFSHPGAETMTDLDINHAIEGTITVASNEWKYVAELETDFDRRLPLVPCLPGEFNQVILNMIVNAAHAVADAVRGGRVGMGTIAVRTRQDGEFAEVRISDTGAGIPEDVRDRIFDPFFTTKEVGKGTGQGLSIAHNVIVQRHAGTLDFETEIDKGTTFIIRLPLEQTVAARESG